MMPIASWFLLALLLGALVTGCDDGEPSQSAGSPVAGFEEKHAELERHKRFRLYYLGRSFAGFELSQILYDRDPWRRVSFIYGDCSVPAFSDGGCAPPVEVQVAPSCRRDARSIRSARRNDRIRGVPTARVGGGLVLYTGDVAVTIFGRHQTRAARVARPLDADRPSTKLPPPSRAARQGIRRCRS